MTDTSLQGETPIEAVADAAKAWRRPDRRVAIVTGAGSGAGAAIARAFAADGARVLVSDVDYVLAGDVAADIRDQGGVALAHRCDVTSDEQVAGLFERAQREFGALDYVVNNAGPRDAGDPLAHALRIIDVNLLGTVRVTVRAIEAMRARGGAILNIAAAEGLGGAASAHPAFAAAKAGVLRFTTGLEDMAADCGIRLYCVAPDRIDSPEGFADLIVSLSRHVDCARRVVLYRAGAAPLIIAADDAGYGKAEPF
jgi:NAD(P)-dependent dehydrogenase (short-subunit alcohol dehydrogenase family)